MFSTKPEMNPFLPPEEEHLDWRKAFHVGESRGIAANRTQRSIKGRRVMESSTGSLLKCVENVELLRKAAADPSESHMSNGFHGIS